MPKSTPSKEGKVKKVKDLGMQSWVIPVKFKDYYYVCDGRWIGVSKNFFGPFKKLYKFNLPSHRRK